MKNDDIGPTGQFPDGKIDPSDKGELIMSLRMEQRRVMVEFGAPVKWFALDTAQARRLALQLTTIADAIDAGEFEDNAP